MEVSAASNRNGAGIWAADRDERPITAGVGGGGGGITAQLQSSFSSLALLSISVFFGVLLSVCSASV